MYFPKKLFDKNLNNLVIGLIATIFYSCLALHDIHAISLDQALKTAISNNPDIKLEKSRLERVKATSNDAISEFLPDINAVYQKGRQKNDAISLNRVSLDKMNDQDVKQLNLTQPIFDGFKSYNYDKEIGYNIKSAENFYYSKKDKIIFEAITTYLNFFRLKETLKIKQKISTHSKQLVKLSRQRNKFGKIGGSEVMRYQSFLSNSVLEEMKIKKDLFQIEEQYYKIFGEINHNLLLPQINPNKIPINKQKVEDLAIANNHNLKNYRFKIKSTNSALNKAKGEFSPKVEISASVSQQENVTYLNNSDLRSESFYLNVSVPIFQKGTEYFSLKKARRNLNFAKSEFYLAKQNLLKDLKQTYKEYLFYEDLIKNYENLMSLTQNRYDKINQQVKLGKGDILDLHNIQIEFARMEQEDLNNKIDYILSYYKILMLVGNL